MGTLQRDTDDTIVFHTNLNTVRTTRRRRPRTPPNRTPSLPTTPWHHTRHWINPRPIAPVGAWRRSW